MAHLLEERDGAHSFVFNGQRGRPWHELGIDAGHDLNIDDALRLARADIGIELVPLVVDGQSLPYQVIRRVDTRAVLGVVGEDWTPISFRGMLESVGRVVVPGASDAAFIDTCGVIAPLKPTKDGDFVQGPGSRPFASVPFGRFAVAGQDEVEQHLMATVGLDGSFAAHLAVSTVRAVCSNTVTAALGRASHRITVRHTKNAEGRIDAAAKIIGKLRDFATKQGEVYSAMAAHRLTDARALELVPVLLPTSAERRRNGTSVDAVTEALAALALDGTSEAPETSAATLAARARVFELYQGAGVGADLTSAKGTAWGLYNAWTQYSDREAGRETTAAGRWVRATFDDAVQSDRSRVFRVLAEESGVQLVGAR